ncbi:hypothetical protein [Mycobacterium lepromatosis]|uniref:hypothetical protein n=1 Tax=Mycobacterium lepromatosis TaxID=480418 RepID=UPI000A8F8BA5|nr:hypothetical protein [Mycobacterium lepromatosis]
MARLGGHSVGAVIADFARRPLRPGGIAEVDGLPVFDVPPYAPRVTFDDVVCYS